MVCTWLSKRRDKIPGMTQEALATAVGIDKRAIGKLERCEPGASKRPPYDRLAKALNVGMIALADDHARDLRALGQQEQAEQACKVAADCWRKQRFKLVDVDKLEAALQACAETGLIAGIAQRKPNPIDAAAQAEHLAELLLQGRMNDLFSLTRIPLENAIAAAYRVQQLDALHGFLTEVARQSAAEDSDGLMTGGEWHRLPDGTRAWAIRALIDRSCELDGMRLVQPEPDSLRSRFDDGPDSTLAVRSGYVTQADADARLYELVLGIGERLPTVKSSRPAPDDADEFAAYCADVNQELQVYNHSHQHVFGIWDPSTMEAGEVKDRLLLLLPNLRLFACEPDLGERPLLRMDPDSLEGWYVFSLRKIQQRRRELMRSSPGGPNPTQPKESQPVSNQPIYNFDNNKGPISIGDNSTTTQANDQSTVNQINAADNQQLLQALEQLLANTDRNNATHVPFRNATRDLSGELEETGKVSPSTVARFERAKEGLSLSEQVLRILTNVSNLLAQAGITL
jgi:transcriptional regulator with XRE-family HTH domain